MARPYAPTQAISQVSQVSKWFGGPFLGLL